MMKRNLTFLAAWLMLFVGVLCLSPVSRAQLTLMGAGSAGSGVPNVTLISAITTASLTTNLKLALDAGDSNSYPGSGTKWLDTSGGGYDFFKGTDGTTAAPTFNGSAGGISSAEYWSFNGAQYFTYDTTNETWMQNIHKDNALFSYIVALYFVAGNTSVMGDTGALVTGFVNRTLTGAPNFTVRSSSTNVLVSTPATALTTNGWNIYGLSLNEAGGNVSFHYLNGAYNQVAGSDTFDGAYTSPAAGNATATMQIAARGAGGDPITSGTRLGFVGIFEGVALSKANFDTLYAALKGRYGL